MNLQTQNFPTTTEECTFFSNTHRILFRIESILDKKTNIKQFKKTEITPSIFSDYNRVKSEINNSREWKHLQDVKIK